MWDWIADNAWVAWVGVATLLAVAELLSLDLVLLMFAVAALAGAATSTFAPAWVAMIVFGVVSLVLLMFIRPRIVHRIHAGPTLTVGHHNLVGRVAVVDEPVTSFSGRVEIDGQLWTARAPQGEHHDVGTELVVTSIEGAIAKVAGKAV